MDERELTRILEEVRRGALEPDEARGAIRAAAAVDLGFATVDGTRADRCGFPEVVFCQGKEDDEATAICVEIFRREGRLLATRVRASLGRRLAAAIPEARVDERARVVWARRDPAPDPEGAVLVVSAGTADGAVAREAEITIEMMDGRVDSIRDVGVAGLHRVLGHRDRLRAAHVIVIVAGMDGALPSVVAGLCDRPVIAVPTSVGYGASFGGVAALLTMLNSCATGVTVVNIDNGFGAGYLVNRLIARGGGRDS